MNNITGNKRYSRPVLREQKRFNRIPGLLLTFFVLGLVLWPGPDLLYAEELIVGEEEFGPRMDIKGFADVNYISRGDVSGLQKNHNTFSLGHLELFITSRLSPKTSFLSELVLEGDEENETELDLERVVLEYAYSKYTRIRIGRMHTAISYWNREYHHGRWFHTTSFRPQFFGWEEDRGVLPSHMVGVFLSGIKESKSMDLEYGLGVINGRGPTRTEIQTFQDANDFKGVNGYLKFSSNYVPGLKLGVNGYLDRIPKDDTVPPDPARDGEIKEGIVGGFFVYQRRGVEIINEFAWINHRDEVSDEVFKSMGYYLQVSAQKGDFRPYYRMEFSDLDELDPYWIDLRPLYDDYTAHNFGVRWDVNLWSALKGEYRFNNNHGLENSHDFIVQSAFTF